MANRKIQIHNTHHKVTIKAPPIQRLVKKILINEKVGDAEITIVFADHPYIIDLNTKFLNKTTTTDVISFPLSDDDSPVLVGEIYINIDQIAVQSVEFHESFFRELNRIVVHGVLHLTGYDDTSDSAKKQMTAREDYYLDLIKKEEE
ncbi:rRNA maturation RNase YbeY [candidate division KSB1 bacterium]|nr:rRNA maturation RNase YbeY [candidate division KSB1 bacterium]